MAILNLHKALRSLRKTPLILQHILKPVTQEMAQTLRDGDDGWSILYIMCHLYDYEQIYTERARLSLELNNPTFPVVPSNDELSEQRQYQNQNMREILDGYLIRRQEFIKLLESLTDEQWARQGIHRQTGESTVLHLAINTALHDIDHIGQIIQAMGDNL
jgi:uncharacterized damage-inducible protein DinB